ncbi:MAG: DUF2461 domain-containing protein [Ignavibacteriales bacterium]|nr:DUF2461 domain-containing protein [Ignavibacteriales bacterium]
MQIPPVFNETDIPPFIGFPKEALQFLRRLKKNNNREWFGAHKDEFEDLVKAPMEALVTSLQPGFDTFAPDFDLNPKKAIFRIYRDVRFSKDKSPYKTHIAAHFVVAGRPKGLEGSGYYLHIEPGEVFLGGGIYIPDGDQLKKIRRALAARPKEFLEVLRNKMFRKAFGELQGEKLQRVPAGYTPDNPMVEYLKLKQFFVGSQFKDSVCQDEDFLQLCLRTFATASPLIEFLNDALR